MQLGIKRLNELLEGGDLSYDLVTKRGSTLRFYRGFYYTNGMTSGRFADQVLEEMDRLDIEVRLVSHEEVWKPFRGGASVQQQSHFICILEIL